MYGYVILELRALPGEGSVRMEGICLGAVRWYTAKSSDAVFHTRQSGWDALFCRIVIKTVAISRADSTEKEGGFFMRKREGFVKQAADFRGSGTGCAGSGAGEGRSGGRAGGNFGDTDGAGGKITAF